MNIAGKRVLLYARVSTDDQAHRGESIADQLQALTAWAKEHKCRVVREPFVDAGYSAHKSYKTRPALCRLLECVQSKEADLIAFTKLDRWGRRTGDYYRLQEILEQNGVGWVAILEDYDTATSDGRFKVGIMLSVNQHEAERTSDRIKFTFAEKRKRGELISGNLPRGYIVVDGKPKKDPATMDGVSAFWQAYCSGMGLYKCLDAAAAVGMPMAVSSATYMLRNAKSYTGRIQGCTCEPYITEDECTKILSTRKQAPRKSDHIYLFSGLTRCGVCGGRMGAHRSTYKRKNGLGEQIYYNCTKHYTTRPVRCDNRVNIYERDIESILLQRIAGAVDALAAEVEANARLVQDTTAQTAKRIALLKARRERGWEAYLDGIVSKEEFEAARKRIDSELSCIEQPKQKMKSPEEIRAVLPKGWGNTYSTLGAAHKREFWFRILAEIRILPDRSVEFDLIR